MSAPAAADRRFGALVAAGVLPALLVGLVASAAADRLALAGWGALAAVTHVLVLRLAWAWARRPALTAGVCDLVLVALLAVAVLRHGDEVARGVRALAAPPAALGAPP